MCSSNPSRLQWYREHLNTMLYFMVQGIWSKPIATILNEKNKKMDYSSISISIMEASSMCLVNIESQRPCLP